ALDGAAHHEMVTAPGMVCAQRRSSAGLQGAAKIRFGERHHLIGGSHLYRGVIERLHRLADLSQPGSLIIQFQIVRIEPAQIREKDLASHSELAANIDDLRDLRELRSER